MQTNGSKVLLGHAAELFPIFHCTDCIADLNLETKYCRDCRLLLFGSWKETSVGPLTLGNNRNRKTHLSIASRARP